MDLEDTRDNWEQFGRQDPLWAILAFPDRKNNRWNVDEFFETGQQEIAGLLDRLSSLGIKHPRLRCLDFGCGVGRLSQALCQYFDRCDGVDIAQSMIEQAKRFNRYNQCTYHVNTADDLGLFNDATFDLVYTSAVLQHIEPRYSLKYIAEFVRVLTAQGVAVFEAPSSYTPLSQLQEGAHKAGLELESQVPAVMRPSASISLAVRVTNLGDARWPVLGAPTPIRLGGRWFRIEGDSSIMQDDGRAEMPGLIQPGENDLFNLDITAPQQPGSYILELDMVEEGVTWFVDRGSQSLRLSIRVRGRARGITANGRRFGHHWMRRQSTDNAPERPAATDAGSQPVMEMHCLPREEVLTVVQRAHGEVVHVDEYDAIGDGYTTCRYVVRPVAEHR